MDQNLSSPSNGLRLLVCPEAFKAARVVNAWPVGGTNWRGSSQIRQRFKMFRSSMSNCVPQAVQIRRLSVDEAIMSAGGPELNSCLGFSNS